jgi:hypothetical protein
MNMALDTLTAPQMERIDGQAPTTTATEENVDLYGITGTYRSGKGREPFSGVFVQNLDSKQIVGRVRTLKGLEFTVSGVYNPDTRFSLTMSMPHGQVTKELNAENVLYPGREPERRWAVDRMPDGNYELIVAVNYLGLSR